jgi:tetratricopeptide (TPR) repeat protein
LRWAYRPAAEPSTPGPFNRSPARAVVSLLRCCVAALLWAMSASGAEPNAAQTPAAKPAMQSIDETDARAPDANAVMIDDLRSQLWKSRITPPDPNEDAWTKAALQDLIQRLRSIGAERPVNKPGPLRPIVIAKPAVVSEEPDVTAPALAELSGLPAAPPAGEPDGTLSPAAVEKLNHLTKDPNQVHDPLEMAELLFLNNRPVEAAVFYERALALTAPNDAATSDDRAWILFQLGTSLRQTNTDKARDVYLRLISEFPNSPWTELAKANGRLINWYETTKPQQLISSPAR